MALAVHTLVLRTVGPLTVTSSTGANCTPKGQKARGLLALLARAPGGRRTRIWLQGKLWSTREPEQGAASLRQTLTEIRRAFGTARECLRTDQNLVALDLERVTIDCDDAAARPAGGRDEAIMFEDLEIGDDEFEAWLKEQREAFADAQDSARSNRTKQEIIAAPAPTSRLPQLVLLPHPEDPGARARVMADGLTDIIAKTVAELSPVDIVDLRTANSCDILAVDQSNAIAIAADAADHGDELRCRVVLTSSRDRQLLWSADIRTGLTGKQEAAVLRDVNQIVTQAYRHLQSSGDRQCAGQICRQGIDRLFMLQKQDLLAADQLFEQAHELEPHGIYLAWRGYLRTFLICEHIPNNRQQLGEEALAFSSRALELEPNNSYVASFAAHVQSIVRQSYVTSFELAERSVQLNPANPLGWGCLGIAECYLGKTADGFQHTLHARQLSGTTPFRFFVSGQACFAGSMAGDVDGAIFLAEASHGLAPAFKPPMRFLSALYLLKDEREASQAIVDKLKIAEPNFSYDLLRERSYPASSLHRSGLLGKLPVRQI